jgi:ABC-type bacteriocin/lantibiotic exporter with double-glycine peptidase domain
LLALTGSSAPPRAPRATLGEGSCVEEKGQLDQVPVGSIVHRKDDRFQVVEKVAGERITVLDPFKGRQILPIDTFWADFSGVALFFE